MFYFNFIAGYVSYQVGRPFRFRTALVGFVRHSGSKWLEVSFPVTIATDG